MRRTSYIAVPVTVLAWIVAWAATGSPSLRLLDAGAKDSAKDAPACLPGRLAHSASLPGTGVDVSPEPESVTANPHTQVSFLGASAEGISDVSVVGSSSGPHPGVLRAYSQDDGASFVPDRPFARVERRAPRHLQLPHRQPVRDGRGARVHQPAGRPRRLPELRDAARRAGAAARRGGARPRPRRRRRA